MKIAWHEVSELHHGAGHGVEFSKDGTLQSPVLACVHGYAWLKGGDVQVSIVPQMESYSDAKWLELMCVSLVAGGTRDGHSMVCKAKFMDIAVIPEPLPIGVLHRTGATSICNR